MLTGKTQLIGLIGWPVSHSLSPIIHNAAARALAIDWVYVPLPVAPAHLETAVHGLSALGFQGVNVTIPHKQTVIPLLHSLQPGAQAIGAVNTIVIRDGNYRGYNTDWLGFLSDLQAMGIPLAQRDCLILGAGGSARAVAYALAQAKGIVHVLARRPSSAQQLIDDLAPFCADVRFKAYDLTTLPDLINQTVAPLIINTTPVGMTPHHQHSIWPDTLPFPKGTFVYDLVYNPTETTLIRQAKVARCQVVNGLGMLIRQGALAFALWTGKEPDFDVMQNALKSYNSL